MKIPSLKLFSSVKENAVQKCAEISSSSALANKVVGEGKCAAELPGKGFCIPVVDKSLNPEFLKNLLKIEGETALETCTKIKNEILKAMGYKQPEMLGLSVTNRKGMVASYNCLCGTMQINPQQVSKEEMISLLRHELDHMDKYVKLYKTKGADALAECACSQIRNNGQGAYLPSIRSALNTEFYDSMMKDASIVDFNADKYYRAAKEYCLRNGTLSKDYAYFNNPLEKDAYEVEKKVLQIFGNNSATAPETFPANYKTLLELIQKHNIPEYKQDGILQNLIYVACLKDVEKPEIITKFIKLIEEKYPIAMTDEERAFVMEMYKKVNESSIKLLQQPYNQVETWLREGKYNIDDILTKK